MQFQYIRIDALLNEKEDVLLDYFLCQGLKKIKPFKIDGMIFEFNFVITMKDSCPLFFHTLWRYLVVDSTGKPVGLSQAGTYIDWSFY